MLISDLPSELHFINFDWQTTDPVYFYDVIFGGVSEFIVINKSVWVPGMIMMDMLSSIMLFMIFILISAWMLKARFKVIKFKNEPVLQCVHSSDVGSKSEAVTIFISLISIIIEPHDTSCCINSSGFPVPHQHRMIYRPLSVAIFVVSRV